MSRHLRLIHASVAGLLILSVWSILFSYLLPVSSTQVSKEARHVGVHGLE